MCATRFTQLTTHNNNNIPLQVTFGFQNQTDLKVQPQKYLLMILLKIIHVHGYLSAPETKKKVPKYSV